MNKPCEIDAPPPSRVVQFKSPGNRALTTPVAAIPPTLGAKDKGAADRRQAAAQKQRESDLNHQHRPQWLTVNTYRRIEQTTCHAVKGPHVNRQ